MTLRQVTRALYRGARIANNLDAATHPRRAPNRAKNILIGRALSRSGIWKRWW